MEEDIKILKELIEFFNRNDVQDYYGDFDSEIQAIENILNELDRLKKENEGLKEYIALAPNLDEMTATKYINIQQNSYIQGRAEEQKKYFDLINKIEDKIDKFDYEFEKAKRKNDEDRANYYWDLIRNFKKVLEIEE